MVITTLHTGYRPSFSHHLCSVLILYLTDCTVGSKVDFDRHIFENLRVTITTLQSVLRSSFLHHMCWQCVLILYIRGFVKHIKAILFLRVFIRHLLWGSCQRNIFSYFLFDVWPWVWILVLRLINKHIFTRLWRLCLLTLFFF